MATKKKWKAKRQPSPSAPDPNVHHAKPPQQRLKKLLDVPRQAAVASESLLVGLPLPADDIDRALVLFDAGMLHRGTNTLKAIRTLCGDAHWEFGVMLVRQLFELVLNLENLAAQPDRYDAIVRHAKFGLLQMTLRQQASIEYNLKTGRPVDTEQEAWIESSLQTEFPEFRMGKSPGRWMSSWSGKTTKQLASESPQAIRRDQYEILYREWSEQTHAAPGALVSALFQRFDVDRIIAADDVRISETIASAMTFFIDLLHLLRAVPIVTVEQQAAWMAALVEEAHRLGHLPPRADQRPDS